ncbi:MAG: CarboxypepD reg-like domain, partial [Bacteroidota bacterium]
MLTVTKSVAQKSGIFIVDTLNKIPVQNALVHSNDFKFNATADENGFVSLNKISQNISSIIVSCIGYQSKEVNLNL